MVSINSQAKAKRKLKVIKILIVLTTQSRMAIVGRKTNLQDSMGRTLDRNQATHFLNKADDGRKTDMHFGAMVSTCKYSEA